MRIRVQPPSAQDATDLKVDAEQIDFEPIVVRGVPLVRVCYIAAVGDGGAEARAVVMFNGRNGQFSLQQIDESATPAKLDFDRPKTDFEKRRESKKEGGKRIAAAANANRQAEKTDSKS